MKRDYPLTAEDIRHIADRVDEVLAVVGPDGELTDDDWRWGLTVTIWNQDGDQGDVAGVLAPHGDGYFGFYPRGIERRPMDGEQS